MKRDFAQAIKRVTTRPLATALCALVSGCAALSDGDPEYSVLGGGGDRVNSAGLHQALGSGFERVDLVELLLPEGLSEGATKKCNSFSNHSSDEYVGCEIDAAFDQFHAGRRDNPFTRNVIQDRIIAASDQRCNVFLNYIQRHKAATNFGLGSLTSLLAGGGAIATGATAARALAGSAGIASGVRAEYDQNYYYNQTVSIITKGINQRRKVLLDEIDVQRQKYEKTVALYTVERAIGDALRYHGACSIMAGLEQTNTSLSLDADLDAMKNKLTKLRELRSLMPETKQENSSATVSSATNASSPAEAAPPR